MSSYMSTSDIERVQHEQINSENWHINNGYHFGYVILNHPIIDEMIHTMEKVNPGFVVKAYDKLGTLEGSLLERQKSIQGFLEQELWKLNLPKNIKKLTIIGEALELVNMLNYARDYITSGNLPDPVDILVTGGVSTLLLGVNKLASRLDSKVPSGLMHELLEQNKEVKSQLNIASEVSTSAVAENPTSS